MAKKRSQQNGLTKEKYLKIIAKETAKMGAPGQFYGPVLSGKGNKQEVINFFVNARPIVDLWSQAQKKMDYKKWHIKLTNGLAEKRGNNKRRLIADHIRQSRNHDRKPFPISAKLVDTFMHQLMKYEKFRYLYKQLHLPLDSQVFKKLEKDTLFDEKVKIPEKLQNIAKKKNAYAISSKQYATIQEELLKLLDNINKVLPPGCKLKARIELNSVLWALEEK
jgi:hypothetical protein